MPALDSLFDTPVRHDKDSITKTSLIYRPKQKIVERVRIIGGEENAVKKICLNGQTTITYASAEEHTDTVDGRLDLKTGNDISMIEVDGISEMSSTCENLLSVKCHIEEEVISTKETHSTPSFLVAQNKTVSSSTPNQETLNSSRLKRCVASQTKFTLIARELREYDESLKPYVTEIQEGCQSVVDHSHTSSCNMGNTSPLRSLCISKLPNLNTPVDPKGGNVRKLSLRSKTMITSAIERSKDILPRYKSLDEKRLISNTFSLLPRSNTPPPCPDNVVLNPFEINLSERLGKPIFSPDVFENVLSPSEDSESMRWTIEDISSVNPVAIEEDFTLPSDDEDLEMESQVQQEIERYFSETHLVLSPDEISQKSNTSQSKPIHHHKRAVASTPRKFSSVLLREFNNAYTQTVLTLPVVLSNGLELGLKNFFKIFETDDFNISASTLRRKLFFHSEDEPPSPVRFEIHSSPITTECWVSDNSPFAVGKNVRHFTPQGNQGTLSSPEMSPVVPESINVKLSTCKKTLHHCFTGNHLQAEEQTADLLVDALENSVVMMPSEIITDCDSNSLALPTSQDKCYHTEESWQHCHPCSMMPSETVTDCDSNSLALPTSQDTGYHTEESWQHCHPCSMMASTPTRLSD